MPVPQESTRSQALPGNTDPEALPPIFLPEQARQSLWISVPRQSLGTSYLRN
ncbi:hypothetical protein [Microcoleus sp. T2B6]|uniref:hypothetical protein n=1 Tax=Microcoleus sp. T2B6 TaxID=3055424 RepID=UPI002FD2339C